MSWLKNDGVNYNITLCLTMRLLTTIPTKGRSQFWIIKIMPFMALKKGVQYK